jgi:antitoxin MazE
MRGATKTQVAKWGHSLAVRIPKAVAEGARLREGDALTLAARKNGVIVMKPSRVAYNLKDLVAKITPRNRQSETDWGQRVGREAW